MQSFVLSEMQTHVQLLLKGWVSVMSIRKVHGNDKFSEEQNKVEDLLIVTVRKTVPKSKLFRSHERLLRYHLISSCCQIIVFMR